MGNNFPCPECCPNFDTGTSGDCPCCIQGTERVMPVTFRGVTNGSLGECCSEINGELFLLAFGCRAFHTQRCRWCLPRSGICREEDALVGINIELDCFTGFPTWWRTFGCWIGKADPARPTYFELDGTPAGTEPFDCTERVELTHFGPVVFWCTFEADHGAVMILNPDPDDLN